MASPHNHDSTRNKRQFIKSLRSPAKQQCYGFCKQQNLWTSWGRALQKIVPKFQMLKSFQRNWKVQFSSFSFSPYSSFFYCGINLKLQLILVDKSFSNFTRCLKHLYWWRFLQLLRRNNSFLYEKISGIDIFAILLEFQKKIIDTEPWINPQPMNLQDIRHCTQLHVFTNGSKIINIYHSTLYS